MRPLFTICLLNSILLFMLSVAFTGCNEGEDPVPQIESVTDIDGNSYSTVTIGDQVWMAENLKVTRYRNGDPLYFTTDDQYWNAANYGAFCTVENDTALTKVYGRLYNGFAIGDPRNLAPEGWRIPTDADWDELVNHLGGDDLAGGKLKEGGTEHWSGSNVGATNESGFTALPSGARLTSGDFAGRGLYGCYWSSTETTSDNYLLRCFWATDDNVDRRIDGAAMGMSVRCIKE